MEDPRGGRQVWRVRLWVRLLSVVVLLLPVPFLFQPQLLNPTYTDGMPASEWFWAGVMQAALLLAAWSAFRSRIEVADGRVRVVNPWGTREFPAAEVREVAPGSLGVAFFLVSGRTVAGFAVQATAVHLGPEPRWFGVARAVTGREPG